MASENFPHDAAYKAFFSNPDMVKSLLLDFVPEEFIRHFDLYSLEECSASYIAADLQQRHDDIVWRVHWEKGWCYIYILLEFQSTQDYWMPLRILAYTSLLWENLIRQGVLKTGDKLPPVFPIVIYNGEGAWTASRNIHELISILHDKLSGYQPSQKYFLLDENRISQLLLESAKGESAYIFRLEKAKSAKEILDIANELSQKLKDSKYDFLRRSIYTWISRLIKKRTADLPIQNIAAVEDKAMLEQRIAQWEEELMQKGMLIGEEKGRAEGLLLGKKEGRAEGLLLGQKAGIVNQKITLREMLADRFNEIPAEWTQIIDRLEDPQIISQLTRAIYKVNSSREFEELLENVRKNESGQA